MTTPSVIVLPSTTAAGSNTTWAFKLTTLTSSPCETESHTPLIRKSFSSSSTSTLSLSSSYSYYSSVTTPTSCVTDTTILPVATASLISVVSSVTMPPTKTVCATSAPTGTPRMGSVHCGVHGLPVGDFFLGQLLRTRPLWKSRWMDAGSSASPSGASPMAVCHMTFTLTPPEHLGATFTAALLRMLWIRSTTTSPIHGLISVAETPRIRNGTPPLSLLATTGFETGGASTMEKVTRGEQEEGKWQNKEFMIRPGLEPETFSVLD
ncbi:hypothetical protein B0H63DRAFT_46328 [Podospora didyma]|uniref:Uncharacterized protein n=1 Tax=Podospora didyma TaxID=330526 RepID=A0AAE0P6X6_9PEZI|nr:hypothetical protein B0H63DRAFT_46328 [Podospora didyma]